MSEELIERAKSLLAPPPCSECGADHSSIVRIEIRDMLADLVPELVAEVEKLRAALSALVDADDCWFDHNGDCQAHGFFDGPCGHAVAKQLLGGPK